MGMFTNYIPPPGLFTIGSSNGPGPSYAPALLLLLLLQDIAYSYRVWITLIKLLYAPLQGDLFGPDIHQGERLCGRLLPAVPLVPEKSPSRRL